MTRRVLHIEDEPGLREDMALELEDAGYAVESAADGAAGLAALRAGGHDLILCDVRVPGGDGLSILSAWSRLPAGRPPFILLTAYSDPELHRIASRLGVTRILVKPVDYPDLLALIAAELAP